MVPFDTLKYARELEALGVPRDQAEGQTRVLFDALKQFLPVRQPVAAAVECRPVVQGESEKQGMAGRLETLLGRRKFVDWVLMMLMTVYVGVAVACVWGVR